MTWPETNALSLGLAVAPCQLRCAYCDAAGFLCARVLPLQDFCRLTQEFCDLGARRGVETLTVLPFSEPANHPDLDRLWSQMHRLGLSGSTAVLATNGIRLGTDSGAPALLSALRDAGLQTVQVTVYGGEDTHDHFAGRQGAYHSLLSCAQRCCAVGLEVRMCFPLFKFNQGELTGLGAELGRLVGAVQGLSPFVFSYTQEGAGLEPERPTWEDVDALKLPEGVANAFRANYRSEAEWVALARGSGTAPFTLMPTTSVHLQIDSSGAAYAWHVHPAFRIGDLREGLERLYGHCVEGKYAGAEHVTPTGIARLGRLHGDATGQGLHSLGSVWAKWLSVATAPAA